MPFNNTMFDIEMIKFCIYFIFYRYKILLLHYGTLCKVESISVYSVWSKPIYYKTLQYRRGIFLNVRYGLKDDIEVEI